jgi:exopolysaccharide biosynthesis polyprenyl glycosylphosphotransferase
MSSRLETPRSIDPAPGRRRRAQRARGAGPDASPFLVENPPPPAVQRRDRIYRGALLAADTLASLLVVGILLTWLGPHGPMITALVILVLVPLVHTACGLYKRDERLINKSTLDEAPNIFQAATLITVLAFLLESALLATPIGAVVVAHTWLGLVVCVPCCRAAARAMAREATPPERCLVVGDHEHGRRLAGKLRHEGGLKAELAGVIPLGADRGTDGPHGGGAAGGLADVVATTDVHRVVIAADVGEPKQVLETIQAAKALGVKVSVLPRVLEVVGSSATFDYVDGVTVLGVPRFGLSRRASVVKRTFDLAGSAAALVLVMPVFALLALLIKATSAGPVFFSQTRIGRRGEPFEMLKFRSMLDGADRTKERLRAHNEADGLFKIADDPRITRVGRHLRAMSLDELPQLINVLRGEMSLVGPRPLVPDEDSQIKGWHRRRLQLTPGMTGPWQVLGSTRIPLREMVSIDYLYVANWSLWEDAKILLRTVAHVLGRRGI